MQPIPFGGQWMMGSDALSTRAVSPYDGPSFEFGYFRSRGEVTCGDPEDGSTAKSLPHQLLYIHQLGIVLLLFVDGLADNLLPVLAFLYAAVTIDNIFVL